MSRGGTPISAGPAGSDAESAPLLHELIRRGRSFSGRERHCCFLNLGNGLFGNVSAVSGLDLPDDGRAIARVDWDGDGDLDLWIANRSGPQVRYMQNTSGARSHYLQLHLVGNTCNRDAIGARVELHESASSSPQLRTVTAGDGFLSQSTKIVHFGMGPRGDAPPEIEKSVVHWPGGQVETFTGLEADGRYRLEQGAGIAKPVKVTDHAELSPAAKWDLELSHSARVVSVARLPMPDLEFMELTSNERRRVSDPLRPVLLNLWASWCQPCLGELQDWADSAEALQDLDLEVVALSVDGLEASRTSTSGSAAAQQTVARLNLPFTCGLATRETVLKLQLVHDYLFDAHRDLPIPTTVLIDGDGRLAVFYKGQTTIETILDDVASLGGEHPNELPFTGRWFRQRSSISPFDFARSLIEHKLLDDAAAYLDRHKQRLQSDPEFPKLLSHLGRELLEHGKEGAVEQYEAALKQGAPGAEHHYNLGLAKQSQGDLPGAMREYQAALRLDENNFRAHNNLAAALASQGKLNQAVTHFRHVVRIDPTYAQGRFNLGNALIGLGQLEAAITQLREAVKLDPSYARAHNNLAVALHRAGRTEEARKHLAEAKRLKSAN